MSGIQVDKEALVQKSHEIDEIDVTLDAQSGSKAAGKRSVVNSLISGSANSEFVSSVVSKMTENFEDEELVGTYYSLLAALESEFDDFAENVVDGIVSDKAEEVSEKLSDAELADIQEQRKALVQEFKALKNILEMFGQDVDDVPEPKIRRGSRGPRGPRTLSKFQYTVNDVALEEDINSLATVAKLSGNIKVKELKEALTAQGIDLSSPPAEWTAELPNGAGTLVVTPLPEFAAEFEDDGDAVQDDAETDAA